MTLESYAPPPHPSWELQFAKQSMYGVITLLYINYIENDWKVIYENGNQVTSG